MALYIKQNAVYPLVVAVIDNNGNYVTGLSITYEVRKVSDNSLQESGTLSNVGNIYTDNITLNSVEEHYALYITPSGYENGKENIIVNASNIDDIQSGIDELLEKICRILGLSQENYRFYNQVYNAEGCLESANIKIYPTKSDTENDTNPIAVYSLTATYTNGFLTDYKVVQL